MALLSLEVLLSSPPAKLDSTAALPAADAGAAPDAAVAADGETEARTSGWEQDTDKQSTVMNASEWGSRFPKCDVSKALDQWALETWHRPTVKENET